MACKIDSSEKSTRTVGLLNFAYLQIDESWRAIRGAWPHLLAELVCGNNEEAVIMPSRLYAAFLSMMLLAWVVSVCDILMEQSHDKPIA